MVNYADGLLTYRDDIRNDIELAKKIMNERLNIYQNAVNKFLRTIGKNNTYFVDTLVGYSNALYSAAFLGQSFLAGGIHSTDMKVVQMERDEVKLSQSMNLYKQALYTSEAVYGMKHPKYLTHYAQIGYVALDERINFVKEAANINKTIFGDHHWQYVASLQNLSGFYKQRYSVSHNEEDFKMAEKLLQRSVNVYRDHFGETHQIYVSLLESMATFYKETNKDKSIEIYHDVLDILKNTIGEDDKRYTYALLRYSGLFLDPSDPDYAEGIKVYKVLTKSIKNNLGIKSQFYSQSLGTLAWLYDQTAQFDKAEAIRTKSIKAVIPEDDQQKKMEKRWDVDL